MDRGDHVKALTIWQPWAALLVSGRKTLECRKAPLHYRGLLALHAGLQVDPVAMQALALCKEQGEVDQALWDLAQVRGAVIGVGEVVGCKAWPDPLRMEEFCKALDAQEGALFELPSTVAEARQVRARKAPWLWEINNAKVLSPIPCKGKQGIWEWER